MSTANQVIDQAASIFGVESKQLLTKSRELRYFYPRAVACYVLHRQLRISSTHVARLFNRSHATILHACRICDDYLDNPVLNRPVAEAIEQIRRTL